MSDARRYITGVLLTEQGGAPIADATVLVTRGTGTRKKVIGRARSDGKGRYSVRVEDDGLTASSGALSLRVEHQGKELDLGYDSQASIELSSLPLERDLWATVPIQRPRRPKGNALPTWHITGSLRHVDGSVPDDGDVSLLAMEVGIAGSDPLELETGESATYTNGTYVIPLAESVEGKNVRVLVKNSGGTVVLGASQVTLSADENPRIDILLSSEESRGKAEYARLKIGVEATLSGGLAAGQLSADHLLYIGATRSLEAEALGRYEVAARVAGKLTIPTGQESTDWTEHIFGLISVGWPSSVPELLSRPWSRVSAALELAYQRGHIRAAAAAQSSALEQVWNTSRVALALVDDASATKGSLKPILVAAGVPEEDPDYLQTALVTEWVNHTGTVATFWENLREHSTLGAYADEVQRAFQVGALVGNHAPMVGKVLEELDGAALRTLCDMEEADWVSWIGSTWNSQTVGWPSRYDEESEPEDAYAADIVAAVATAFPARRTAHGVADGTGVATDLYTSFSGNTNNADLIAHFAGDLDFDPGGAPVSGTADDTRIRRFQRLYRLAPAGKQAEATIRLYENTSVRSARDIASMGKRRFLSTATGVSVGFESADALEIFQKARNLSSMATILASMLHPSLRRGFAAGLVEVTGVPSGEGAPDVATLFGPQDTCACDPCLSVLSPSAYLVDLLQWVEERGGWSDDATPPQWALNGRRPDLGQIALSCENTFRVLPYVDLVNEVLEDAVAGLDAPPPPTVGDTGYVSADDFDPVAPSERDTTLTPEELLVTPEYRNDTAYDRLEDADTAYYSHQLPYHHDNAEQRAFLGILGLRRQDLLELGDAGTTALALEELGLCQGDVDLITGSQHGARRWGFFGDTTNAGSVASFIDALSGLRTLRDRSGLNLDAILELLHCRAVNPEIGSVRPRDVLIVTLDDGCSLDASLVQHAAQAENEEDDVLTALSVTEIGTLSRFLRVARALGGTLLHADRVLHMLDEGDAGAFDTETLSKVGLVARLSRQLGLDRETVSSFFSYFDAAEHLDTWQDRDAATKPQICLYDRLFMDARRFPDATSEATWEDWPFVLDAARTALEIETHLTAETRPLTSYAAQIAAALRVSLPELAEAIDWSGEEALSFTALGALHRRVKLAASLGRPVREVRRLAELVRPTSGALSGDLSADWIFESPAAMSAFVDEIGRLSVMRVDTATALYLVAHDEHATTALRPTAAETQNALGALRDELRSLSSDYPLSAELGTSADVDTLEALIREILELDDETVTPAVVDDLIATAQGDWYSAGASARTSRWEDLLSDLSADATARPLLNVLDLYDLRAQLIGQTDPAVERLLTSEADRLSWLDANLRWGAWRLGQRDALRAATAKSLTDLLGRTGRFANRLRELTLSEVWPPASSDESVDHECVDALLTRGFLAFPSVQPDLPYADLVQPEHDLPDALQDAFAVYYALHKVATYVSALGANEDEEEAVLAGAAALGLPDPGAFPASAPEDPRAGWQELRRALVLFAQADRVPGSTPTFAELIAVVDSTSALVELLAQRTGWDSDELATLTGSDWYTGGGGDPVDDLRRLLDALALRDKAGIDASGVIDWLTGGEGTEARDATPALSSAARDAASAATGDPSAWVARARPIRDALRERQRQALLAWLLDRGDSPWDDADDVYEHYLIDVSMGSWLTTSRVQLALAAVQLYVQRNMMGLETDESSAFELDDEDREQWAWMKNYRVWEAARKVFLYPENWTDPELRDDESVFYQDLRSELSQGALDDDHVEGAALSYLEKLRDVHSMHVLTYTRQQETVDGEAIDHTHVLARTRGNPPAYHYRRWEDQRLWTPWEPVDVGVEGDNTLLVVYARRLMLFWLTFEEQSDTSEEAGETWKEIRLNWSERRASTWTPRRTSSANLSLRSSDHGAVDASGLCMVAEISDEDALIIALVARDRDAKVGAFTLDPCTWSVTGVADDEEFTSDLCFRQRSWYQGLAFYGEIDPEGVATYPLYLPTGASALELANLGANAVALTCADSAGLDVVDALSIAVDRAEPYFGFTAPFFVTIEAQTFLVTPETSTSDSRELAAVQDAIGLGDLSSFLDLGADSDPASGEAPEDDVEYAWSGGAKTALTRTTLRSQLSRSFATLGNPLATGQRLAYRFAPFHHPYVCRFLKEVRLGGIFALLNPSELGDAAALARQQITEFESEEDLTTNFEATYAPNVAAVPGPYPYDEIDFSSEGAYAHYNWELFLHLPWLVSTRLRADQRYEESLDWLHCIFDPRSRNEDWEVPERYWKLKPFLEPVDADPSDWEAFTGADGDTAAAVRFERQVSEWQSDPFNPHLLARLRPGTYPKAIFMAYLDTLIGWGDHLFEQDTRESLQEATQIYVVAKHLLGDRPVSLPRDERPAPSTYEDLRDALDEMSSALLSLENYLPEPTGAAVAVRTLRGLRLGSASLPSISLYTGFCVPPNPKLLGYWDTIEDRLFKIRNGLNLAGERRSLDLFAPPIDPGALVAARAGGQTLQSALAASAASLPNHRFVVMQARAAAMAGSVRALGGALLSALEKKDAEALSLLRQGHEQRLLEAVQTLREQQVEEAEAQVQALEQSRANVEARRDYYQRLIDEGLNGWEAAQLELSSRSLLPSGIAMQMHYLAAGMQIIPELALGIAARAESGGNKLAGGLSSVASMESTYASILSQSAGMAATQASYARRAQEWTQQVASADLEVKQLDAQIIAANLRKEITARELANHKLQREQSAEVERWLRSKYTSQSLYQWLTNATASLYFSAYKLAVDLARQAERSYQHELGVQSSSYIQYGHWDSLKKGLLAGERLAADLERLDAAYLAGDRRELELVKHVSVAQLDPFAILAMQNAGECWVDLPEALFDLDCPGHYFRRLQAVTLSIACVSGPQANVNVELTLQSSKVRRTPKLDPALLVADAAVGTTTIVTSTARDDGGLFQLDLRDPRYLPFERRGAVSTWRVRMCNQTWRQIDWSSITDIVLHLRYTALSDAGLRDLVLGEEGLAATLPAIAGGYTPGGSEPSSSETAGLVRMSSARRDQPDAWYVAQQTEASSITFTLGTSLLPAFATAPGASAKVGNVHVLVVGAAPSAGAVELPFGTTGESISFTAWGSTGIYLASSAAFVDDAWPADMEVTLTSIGMQNVTDVIVVLEYTVEFVA